MESKKIPDLSVCINRRGGQITPHHVVACKGDRYITATRSLAEVLCTYLEALERNSNCHSSGTGTYLNKALFVDADNMLDLILLPTNSFPHRLGGKQNISFTNLPSRYNLGMRL
jgi:hypothetical protein